MQDTNKKLNFVFFGTPDVASETLEILKQAGFLPSLVVASPDARAGRKMLLTPPPAKLWAIENNVPYTQPEKLNEEDFKENFDLFIVVAYGKIIPENILKLPKLGSINIHYSLLPKYRGASPVESAILHGETVTGVTIQQMEFKLDSGPVVAREEAAILPDETAPELRKRLIKIGGELLVKTLRAPFAEGEKQEETQATHSKKIKKEDGLVDLEKDSSDELWRKYRAYQGWPRIFFFKNGKRIIITKAKLENGKFVVEKIIPEGGKERDYKTA
jgi:methionyl-tRNA formyltransferase